MEQLIYPTARGMCAEGTPFRGVIFAGLMIKDGQVGGAACLLRGPGRRRCLRLRLCAQSGQAGPALPAP